MESPTKFCTTGSKSEVIVLPSHCPAVSDGSQATWAQPTVIAAARVGNGKHGVPAGDAGRELPARYGQDWASVLETARDGGIRRSNCRKTCRHRQLSAADFPLSQPS